MKHLLVTFCFATVILIPGLSALNTQFLDPVVPTSPRLMAQGGVGTAVASGFDALFYNPAAFSEAKTEVTFFSLETTGHLPLSGINELLEARSSFGSNPLTGPLLKTIDSLVAKGTIGQEVSTGAGWVGNNLGLGIVAQGRATATGPNIGDAKALVDVSLMGIIGMAWPFDVGLGTLRLGGTVRPLQRTISQPSATELLKNFSSFSKFTVVSGFGMGLDLGLRWDYANFQTGLVIRDASGTVMNFKQFGADAWVSGYMFPSGGDAKGETIYRIPTVIGFGSSWSPDMGTMASLFQPTLGFDLQVPLKDQFQQSSFWTWTHIGAEAKLLRFVSVRTGLNQGYLTFGLGAKLFIVDFNLAIFADELGRYSGVNRRSGISLDWAFRL